MATILHIDASIPGEGSRSRTLTDGFLELWKQAHPEDEVIRRDLMADPPSFLTYRAIEEAGIAPDDHTPEMKAALKQSDELVAELLAADRCVFTVPMQNYSVPAVFKAWIDQVVVPGRTFEATGSGFRGLVTGRKLLVVATSGEAFTDSEWQTFDHHKPYLMAVASFIGLSDVQFVRAEGLDTGAEEAETALDNARQALSKLAREW